MSIYNAFKVCGLKLPALVLCAVCLATIGAPAQAQSPASVPLNGTWLMHAGDDTKWAASALDETTWQKVNVPGVQLPAGFSWLRFHFTAPAGWSSDVPTQQLKTLTLHLGAIHGAAWVYFNGYFTINSIGSMPTAPDGTGYKGVDQSDDYTAQFPLATPVVKGGAPVNLVNFGVDNVIALRIYIPSGGPDPSGGTLMLSRPTFEDIYPIETKTDKADHVFTPTDPVQFDVHFANTTAEVAPLSWQLGISDEGGTPVPGLNVNTPPSKIDPGKIRVFGVPPIPLPTPGVYRYVIHTKINDQTLPDTTFAAAYDVGKIHEGEDPPADLSSFWSQVVTHAAASPTHTVITKTGDTDGVATYQVAYDGFDGKPAHAWLSVPDDVSASPVEIVHIPAYDSDPQQPDKALAAKGYVVLDFIATASDWTTGNADQHYLTTGVSSQYTYIMRSIEGNVLKVIGILRNNPAVGITGKPKIVVWGESQGGGLAIITAALLKQDVSAVVAISPYLTDIPQLIDMTTVDTDPFIRYFGSSDDTKREVIKSLRYFDTINLASQVTAPTFIGVGLLDPIAPPSTAFALSNKLTASHTMDITVDGEHVPGLSGTRALTWLSSKVK